MAEQPVLEKNDSENQESNPTVILESKIESSRAFGES